MKKIGLYIHIPFCNGKCPYCDFYSINYNRNSIDNYAEHIKNSIKKFKEKNIVADTVYFGGGTPGLMGTEHLSDMLKQIKEVFGDNLTETTAEINPESALNLDFNTLKNMGLNRVSIGLQSANNNELIKLGRKHTAYDAAKAVESVKKGGIDNISLDLMIGIEEQTLKSLEKSIDFCASLDVTHISSYILKIEEGTQYFKQKSFLNLPDEDEVCDMYEFMVNKFSEYKYTQYEISNFAKKGYESKHNLKYWNCDEYIGIGPSAHSFFNGKRFYYGRSIKDFYANKIIADGNGGDEEEYIAMQLRLANGICFEKFKAFFGYDFPEKYKRKAEILSKTPYLYLDEKGIRLTTKGFLCSNSIIVSLIT